MKKELKSTLGMYIHIPFCKQACSYCNFYFSTNQSTLNRIVDAICTEIGLRNDFWTSNSLSTIYFGGGTPSILSTGHIEKIIASIKKSYKTTLCSEITFECNPDDINEQKLKEWKRIGINRLSIGVQSFYNQHLLLMNRAHNAKQSYKAIELAQKNGFNNLTVDLIYGIPKQSNEQLKADLQIIADLNIPHFSAYALTVEPKTVLAHQIKTGKINEVDDDVFKSHFEIIKSFATEHGYQHYEISNFAKPTKRALHNSSYWKSKPYIGIGPAAHSYNLDNRFWNIANNHKYLKAIENGNTFFEIEKLSKTDHYNEYLLTRLRTIEGVNILELNSLFPEFIEHFNSESKTLLFKNLVQLENNIFTLTNQGQFLCDYITAQLMV
ncbi:MAG: radical SAM family heme chaperone HemW [Bacteroidia bacterium]